MASVAEQAPAVGTAQPPSTVPSLTDTDVVDVLHVEQVLLEAVRSAESREAGLAAVLQLVHRLTSAIAVVYVAKDDEGRFSPLAEIRPRCSPEQFRSLLSIIQQRAATACQRGAADLKTLSGKQHLVAITVPVMVGKEPAEALSVVLLVGAEPVEPFLIILQLTAAAISLWNTRGLASPSGPASARAAEMLDLIQRLVASGSQERAAQLLAGEIQSRWKFDRVAIGFCRPNGKRCRLAGLSGTKAIDRRHDLTLGFESVMDEALLQGKTVVCPAPDGSDVVATEAQKRLRALCDAEFVISAPLASGEGKPIGVWVFVSREPISSAGERMQQIRTLEGPVGWSLGLLPRLQQGPIRSALAPLCGCWSGWRGVAKAAAVLAIAAVLAVPLPYKVKCECILQPVTRRFVAAPFDARLEEAFVEPGDLVRQGQVLAQLNGREIRWELAGLAADASRAEKMRDTSLASQDIAASQMAALEMERLGLKNRLLEDRVENLEVKAPIDGLVIAGDLKKTEGAPVPIGQVLFEIAPLDKMVAEVEIPDEQISHVEVGQQVVIHLDAHAALDVRGTLAKIHPRAEVRNGENVFVAEVLLDNDQYVLRPGMNGTAKVVTAAHPLGWNLFHKAYEKILSWFGW